MITPFDVLDVLFSVRIVGFNIRLFPVCVNLRRQFSRKVDGQREEAKEPYKRSSC